MVAAGGRVRRHFFANRVKLNLIVNMKSGLCPEDCSYFPSAEVPMPTSSNTTGSIPPKPLRRQAEPWPEGQSGCAWSPAGEDRATGTSSGWPRRVRVIKERHPNVEICTSLGLLTAKRAERLIEAGVYAYNHNLNTSEANYGEICSTHTFADRVDTLGVAHDAGLSPCSGAIFGMGETDDEIVDLAFDLRKLDPDSVPINFLIPFAGTPMADEWQLTPQRCLRILALYRFFFPERRGPDCGWS